MASEDMDNQFGKKLKEVLNDQSISLRKLSEKCKIDSATLSRLINGKRKATPTHIERIANALYISSGELYKAAGYNINHHSEDLHSLIDEIKADLTMAKLYDNDLSISVIEKELTHYKQFANTSEGKETVKNHFKSKLEKAGSAGPLITELQNMFSKFTMKQGTMTQLTLMGAALIYFISTVDCIPDYIFPIGYIDDAIAIKIVSHNLKLS